MLLEVCSVTKRFGTKEVLREVSFTAEPGKALGLLGRNGAGKTTTIRIVMDVFPPDEGEVLFGGSHLRHTGIRVGYLPEERGLYPKIPVGRQLVYLARLRGLEKSEAHASMKHWLDRLEMSEYVDKKLETLSKGNQQKIQLALALLANPEVIILDEPFSGLDPVNAGLLKDIVTEQVDQGKIVLFSSHQMGYVEEFCENVAILNGGGIILSGSIRAIKRSYPRTRIAIRVGGADGATAALIGCLSVLPELTGSIAAVDFVGLDICEVRLSEGSGKDTGKDALLAAILATGASVETFAVVEPTLEEIFIEKTGDAI